MASESTTPRGQSFSAQQTDDEVVLRFPSLNRLMRAFLPDEAVKHMYAAQREQLLAVRVLVDRAIQRIEAAEQNTPVGPRRTEIRVE